jgi:CheY-like chemotaxis protein
MGLELIRLAGDTPGSIERVRATMERQVGHMVRLIDDLLDVSRITSGKLELQPEPTPLNMLVNSAIDANRAAIAAKQIELSVDLPTTLCVLDVDPTRFIQVISNLLHNSAKFTGPRGSIRVAAHVNASDGGKASELSLSVIDSGIGISAELLPHIFELFTQGERGTSVPGLGIGLALARRLVEMHGGEIEARSDGLGTGSAFLIQLPLPATDVQLPLAERTTAPTLARRVVVIDDNHDAADTTAMVVEALGGKCRVAYDGLSGVDEVLANRTEIVLLDIGMPGLDGYETCSRIRRGLGRDVIVVALTGFGQEQDRDKAFQCGFDAHLTKPVNPKELANVLSELRVGPDVDAPSGSCSYPQ